MVDLVCLFTNHMKNLTTTSDFLFQFQTKYRWERNYISVILVDLILNCCQSKVKRLLSLWTNALLVNCITNQPYRSLIFDGVLNNGCRLPPWNDQDKICQNTSKRKLKDLNECRKNQGCAIKQHGFSGEKLVSFCKLCKFVCKNDFNPKRVRNKEQKLVHRF